MTRYLSGILIVVLSIVLCMPTEGRTPSIGPTADGKIGGVGTGTIVGVVVAVVAVVAIVTIVTIVVIHESKDRTITGCVNPTQNGMTVTDEKDKRAYILSGDTAGAKPGERMTLKGKIKPKAGEPLVWNTTKTIKDFGACQP
jgi:hypothetical protein